MHVTVALNIPAIALSDKYRLLLFLVKNFEINSLNLLVLPAVIAHRNLNICQMERLLQLELPV